MALITETYLRARLVSGIPNPFPLAEGDKLTPAAADFLKSRGVAIQRTAPHRVDLGAGSHAGGPTIPVGVSNRHVHLSAEHVEALFGTGYRLTPLRELSQKGQFAAKETVTLVGPKGIIPNVRILGPSRGSSQAEISRTDGFTLGVHPLVRLSGHIEGTPGITIVGDQAAVVLQQGLIVAKNHVHMSPADADRFRVANGDTLILQTLGDRPMLFAEVVIRVAEAYSLDFHIDTDEANAANLNTGDVVRVAGRNGAITGAVRGY